MDTEIADDFINFVKKIDPNAEVENLTVRSLDAIREFLIFVSTTGVFSGLWTLFQAWRSHKRVADVQVEYFTDNQVRVQINYANRTLHEVEEIIRSHPPKKGGSAKVSILTDKHK